MSTKREDYAKHFLESVESIWGKELIELGKDIVLKTGEAVYDIDNYILKPEDEPETKPRGAKN